MKLILGTLILSATAAVFAQDAPPTPPTPAKPARVAIMSASGADVVVAGARKNAPFTADESGETVRVMPDGNRIVEHWTGKTARNSEGRTRREITSGQLGNESRPFGFEGNLLRGPLVGLGTLGSAAALQPLNAVDGTRSVLRTKVEGDNAAAGARTIVLAAGSGEGVSVYATGNGDEAKRVLTTKIEASAAKDGTWVASGGTVGVTSESGVVSVARGDDEGKFQIRKEDLGTRDFGGVKAEGHRIITTYAAGAVGNEREIEVTTEIWFSKDLGVIVYSKRNDPRTGETTYQMTNIVRAEPDASLFPGR